MARDFVGEPRVGFLHARHGSGGIRVAFRVALLEIPNGFDPSAHALRGWAVDAMLRGKAQAFDRNGFAYARGIHTAIVQNDAATERMADEANRKIVDDVEKRGKIEDVLGDAVDGPGGPSTVAVPAQIEGVDVIVLAEDACDPIPITSVVQAAVNEHQRRLAILPIVPELQLEAVGVEEVRDGFQGGDIVAEERKWWEARDSETK